MKTLLRFEELMMFVFGIILFTPLGYPWWWFPLLLLAPDLSALGYLAGPLVGAHSYNLAHHKGIALLIYLSGFFLGNAPLQLAGIILFAHSSLDRVLGYGLKYPDAFQHTHLGWIGKASGS